ncbi:hypothetical protein GMSM_14350 [Geomonas sp. Red276]
MAVEKRDGLCGICPAGCFVTATLQDGRLTAVEPREGHPLGMICHIGRHSIQPVAELAALAHARGALFHCDAVQGFGKMPIDVEALGVDLLALSAHKLHGPKGVGALYVGKDVPIEPLITGGGQEHGLRAGTQNVPGIAGFAKAVELSQKRLYGDEPARQARLRDRLEEGIRSLIAGARRNGPREGRLVNTLNMILPGIRGESLVLHLDRKGIAFSSGSAYKSGNPDPPRAARHGALAAGGALRGPLLARGGNYRRGDRLPTGGAQGDPGRDPQRRPLRPLPLTDLLQVTMAKTAPEPATLPRLTAVNIRSLTRSHA